jgi:hypothetical protein
VLKKEGRIIDDPAAAGWVETSPGFWEYRLAPLVEEAPVDSKQYARQDAAWSEVVIPEIPDFVETDPTVPDHVKAISTDDTASWSAAYSWGDHREAGYATMMWVQSNYQIKGDYLTTADRLWTDISSETGNNTIERFGDEVWVTNFKNDEVYVGTKIGNGVETTGDLSAGGATFAGNVHLVRGAQSDRGLYVSNYQQTALGDTTVFNTEGAGYSNYKFQLDGSDVLTIDASGDATFSGTVNVDGVVASGRSTSWGSVPSSGQSGLTVNMGTATSATWLFSGHRSGAFKYGMQVIDNGSEARFYTGSDYVSFKPSAGEININGSPIGGGLPPGDFTHNGKITATDFIATSDERAKDNITTAPTGVLEQLHGREWDWKESGEKSAGVVAQELEAVLPHLVHEDDDGMKSVAYNGLVAYLIEEVKALKEEIKDMKA